MNERPGKPHMHTNPRHARLCFECQNQNVDKESGCEHNPTIEREYTTSSENISPDSVKIFNSAMDRNRTTGVLESNSDTLQKKYLEDGTIETGLLEYKINQILENNSVRKIIAKISDQELPQNDDIWENVRKLNELGEYQLNQLNDHSHENMILVEESLAQDTERMISGIKARRDVNNDFAVSDIMEEHNQDIVFSEDFHVSEPVITSKILIPDFNYIPELTRPDISDLRIPLLTPPKPKTIYNGEYEFDPLDPKYDFFYPEVLPPTIIPLEDTHTPLHTRFPPVEGVRNREISAHGLLLPPSDYVAPICPPPILLEPPGYKNSEFCIDTVGYIREVIIPSIDSPYLLGLTCRPLEKRSNDTNIIFDDTQLSAQSEEASNRIDTELKQLLSDLTYIEIVPTVSRLKSSDKVNINPNINVTGLPGIVSRSFLQGYDVNDPMDVFTSFA